MKNNSKLKIAVVTGTRAEYGLLKPLMQAIKNSDEWILQLIVTGAHLSSEFGLTYKQIEEDGFIIDKKVEMLLSSDSSSAITKSMGLAMIGFSDAFSSLKPDAVVILGDRYEMLSVASTALIFKIPIIHLHGGEITEGAYDDSIRHAITKLSHIHFASTEEYRKRIIQLGENPNYVFNVGAIGIDNIKNLSLLNREELEKELGIKFRKNNYQVTFHPETLTLGDTKKQFEILLSAIEEHPDSLFIFTKANADTNGRVINRLIDKFVKKQPENCKAFHSLGSLRYLSLLAQCNAIVGNSSSGIIEAPSLNIGTINIGDRQRGRTQAKTVMNVNVDKTEISQAIGKTKEDNYLKDIKNCINPYGNGNTTVKIIDILQQIDLKNLLLKQFHNL